MILLGGLTIYNMQFSGVSAACPVFYTQYDWVGKPDVIFNSRGPAHSLHLQDQWHITPPL
jgi:hypothetical protein